MDINHHPQDDLLIVIALARFSFDFESAEPENAERAWELAVELANQHGIGPSEVVHQLETW